MAKKEEGTRPSSADASSRRDPDEASAARDAGETGVSASGQDDVGTEAAGKPEQGNNSSSTEESKPHSHVRFSDEEQKGGVQKAAGSAVQAPTVPEASQQPGDSPVDKELEAEAEKEVEIAKPVVLNGSSSPKAGTSEGDHAAGQPALNGTDAPVLNGTDAPVLNGTDVSALNGTDAPADGGEH